MRFESPIACIADTFCGVYNKNIAYSRIRKSGFGAQTIPKRQ